MRYIIWSLILATAFLSGCDPNSHTSNKAGKPRPMDPDAKKILMAFQSALSASDWPLALSFCTQAIQSEADKHTSAAEFCRTALPVEEIIACKKFNAYASKSKGIDLEVIEYRWSVSLKNSDDVYWFCSVRKDNTRWSLDFPSEPLSQYVKGVLADRKRRAEEDQRRQQALLPKLERVTLTLTSSKSSFVLGEPMPFRMEMTNGGDKILYYDNQQVKVNGSMIVKDSKGRTIAYAAGPVQTAGADRPIEAGQTVVLFDGFDLASQYKIKVPGSYTVQFSGMGLSVGDKEEDDSTEYGENQPSFSLSGTCKSNTVQIEVLQVRRCVVLNGQWTLAARF